MCEKKMFLAVVAKAKCLAENSSQNFDHYKLAVIKGLTPELTESETTRPILKSRRLKPG